jgi:hypothetical protein
LRETDRRRRHRNGEREEYHTCMSENHFDLLMIDATDGTGTTWSPCVEPVKSM